MSNLMQMVENEQTSEFYPTPDSLIEKMLSGVDWKYINTILEPSAGKGDILRKIARKEHNMYNTSFDVDCIEIDPNLRQILKYNFSDERECQFDYNDAERKYFFQKGIHIVHDDFLTYNPYKRYDLIIMNPPFSNGDKHLLKALKMQEKGGKIICLLNAETLKNPYTESRKSLLELLNKYNAQIEYIDNAFISAERPTGVQVALIKVAIEQVQEESDIYNHFTFTCPELIDRFNIYAGQRKGWLPPAYGKKAYQDMTAEEKEVIDSFQGEEAYNNVMAKSNYYLAPVVNNQVLRLE